MGKVLFSTRFSARDVLSSSTNFLPIRSWLGVLYPGRLARSGCRAAGPESGERQGRRPAIRMVCEFVRRPRREDRLDGYMPLASAMPIPPPQLGPIQDLMVNLAKKYCLENDLISL